MNYLKSYNLSDEQIKSIEDAIKEHDVNIDIFKYDPEKVVEILNLFLSIGVTNLYNIIIEIINSSAIYVSMKTNMN